MTADVQQQTPHRTDELVSGHHPTLYSAGRHGCWATCVCEWISGTYGTVTAAHLAFGRHLLDRAARKAGAR